MLSTTQGTGRSPLSPLTQTTLEKHLPGLPSKRFLQQQKASTVDVGCITGNKCQKHYWLFFFFSSFIDSKINMTEEFLWSFCLVSMILLFGMRQNESRELYVKRSKNWLKFMTNKKKTKKINNKTTQFANAYTFVFDVVKCSFSWQKAIIHNFWCKSKKKPTKKRFCIEYYRKITFHFLPKTSCPDEVLVLSEFVFIAVLLRLQLQIYLKLDHPNALHISLLMSSFATREWKVLIKLSRGISSLKRFISLSFSLIFHFRFSFLFRLSGCVRSEHRHRPPN